MIPLEGDNDEGMKNGREDCISVLPQTLQDKMTTMRCRQNERNNDNIWDMKTLKTTSLSGQGGYHSNNRG